MVTLTLVALALQAQAAPQAAPQLAPLACPIMGSAADPKAGTSDWMGIRVSYCCAGCEKKFEKDPVKVLGLAAKQGVTSGVFLFDPISHKRLAVSEAVAVADFEGIRYPFASETEKVTFLKEPKKYTVIPAKEALFCPVAGEEVAGYAEAAGFFDFEDVRYFTCCAGCNGKMASDPGKYAPNAKAHVKVAVVKPTPKAE